jgi:hypothetical protein
LKRKCTIALAVLYICKNKIKMGHHEEHHGHHEAEQNEIGGPVTLAIMLFAIAVTVIYFLIEWSDR